MADAFEAEGPEIGSPGLGFLRDLASLAPRPEEVPALPAPPRRPPAEPAKRTRRSLPIKRIVDAARKRGDLVVIAPDGTVTINNASTVEASGGDLDERELEALEMRINGKA